MTTREERRAAAIERAKKVRYEHQVNGASYAHLPSPIIAAVLDASGLLDENEPPPALIQVEPSWLDSEFSGKWRKFFRKVGEKK